MNPWRILAPYQLRTSNQKPASDSTATINPYENGWFRSQLFSEPEIILTGRCKPTLFLVSGLRLCPYIKA